MLRLVPDKKNSSIALQAVSVICLFGSALLFVLQIVDFSREWEALPPGLVMAGIPVGNMNDEEAIAAVRRVYSSPVLLRYEGYPIMLNPSEIGFQINVNAMLTQAHSRADQGSFWAGFWDYLWRRDPEGFDVALSASWPPSAVRAFLNDISARFDTVSEVAGPDLNTLVIPRAQAGQVMDIAASQEAVEAALRSPDRRIVDLVMIDTDTAQANIQVLESLLYDLAEKHGFELAGKDEVGAIFVLDLESGSEINITPGVSFTAVGVSKIPIMITLYTIRDLPLNDETARDLALSMACGGSTAANNLLREIGGGDPLFGTTVVTETMRALGLENTFIVHPYLDDPEYDVIHRVNTPRTPGNTNPGFNLLPNPFMQATPEEIASLLHMVYECAAFDGGALRAAYAEAVTQAECRQMLNVMGGNKIGILIEGGIPPDVPVAHRHGWVEDTQIDAGLVLSPEGRYILAMTFWHRNALNYTRVWPLMEDISRAVYNYFNPQSPLLSPRQNVSTAADCPIDGRQALNLDDLGTGWVLFPDERAP